MESIRTFLFILFAFLTFLLYQEWEADHKPAKIQKAPINESVIDYQDQFANSDLESTDQYIKDNASVNELSENPPNVDNIGSENQADLSSELPASETLVKTSSNIRTNQTPIIVTTDRLRVLITPTAGNIVSAELLKYRETLEKDSQPINILENRNGRVFLALSGLYGKGAPDFKKNKPVYHTSEKEYVLNNGEEELNVDLVWINENGVKYTKRFTFYSGQHQIKVEYIVDNLSAEKIANRMFTALKRDLLPADGQEESGLGMRSYLGPAISTSEDKYEKHDFEDIEEVPLNVKTTGGWIAILQHYFVTAWIPESEDVHIIDSSTKNLGKAGLAQIRITQDWKWIEPGMSHTFTSKLYVGPKIQSDLENVADGLELTVDYGFLWWIGQPIFFLLIFFQSFVVNWGGAIILVTIAIKTLLYPLARAQYRSFAKMRLLQPKMASMKEKFGDDKKQMSMKMMELYKKEKVNPLGGCFPLLIQMPVFIALYWVLMESVELRHAPFILWINDLSVMDPYYVMPLLMGASMFLMQRMQPMSPTMDPMQQKMMQLMPVFMTVFFVFFPAGLVLYWLFNNLISISQQLYITNQFNKEQEVKKK
ncbi:MAG: membrane protein insertase YidC [Gammaproteobacteria bacterium]|nr:MAG: membrane protein insertase YidC [Gammaproteobacteria bacterium]